MAEKKSLKGILKSSSSFDKGESREKSREMKWDEMNILATYHPPDKEYGHIKIDEPPTPYNKLVDEGESGGEDDGIDPDNLASKLAEASPRQRQISSGEEYDDEEEDDPEMSEEERAQQRFFEQKRKLHYNEFQAVKLARQLMSEDDEDEDEEEIVAPTDPDTAANTSANARTEVDSTVNQSKSTD